MFLKFEDCKMNWRSEVLKRQQGGYEAIAAQEILVREEICTIAVAVVMERIRELRGEIDGNW